MTNPTTVEPKSDRELEVTRVFDAPAQAVFDAWTQPELLKRWWTPKSTGLSLLSCATDVRTGGTYRFEFGKGDAPSMAYHGKYLEVTPGARLAWTNDESDNGSITTVSFEAEANRTRLVMHERYPSQEARDAAVDMMKQMTPETFAQLDALFA
jgi:uncharacterized protein YndB with AHSA1/START domain